MGVSRVRVRRGNRARLEAKDGSFFGGEDALLPSLCKQVGPRNRWMLLCTVWFHTYSLLF